MLSCTVKLHILEWPFIVARHNRIFQNPKGEVLANTDLDRFVNNI